MSKKILSMALAVVMLMSIFAFSANAANTTVTTTFPGANQGGYRVVSDAYVGMPAGQEVTVKVYGVFPADTDFSTYLYSLSNVVIAYSTDAYTYNTENDGSTSLGYDGRTWGAAYADFLKPESIVNVGTPITTTAVKNFTDTENGYGWNKAMVIQPSLVTGMGVTQNSGWLVDPDCEIFSLSFTTVRDITANDVIGIPSFTIGKQTQFRVTTGTKASLLTTATIVNSEWAEPAVVAGDDTTTAKMRPGTAAGTVDLGITGTVKKSSFEVAYAANGWTCSNLTAVGVQARVNGVVEAADDNYIYPTDDGFKFRAAITGIDAAGLGANIEVRTYIITDKGTFYSNWMYIDAEDVHTNAVGNGMTGIA